MHVIIAPCETQEACSQTIGQHLRISKLVRKHVWEKKMRLAEMLQCEPCVRSFRHWSYHGGSNSGAGMGSFAVIA